MCIRRDFEPGSTHPRSQVSCAIPRGGALAGLVKLNRPGSRRSAKAQNARIGNRGPAWIGHPIRDGTRFSARQCLSQERLPPVVRCSAIQTSGFPRELNHRKRGISLTANQVRPWPLGILPAIYTFQDRTSAHCRWTLQSRHSALGQLPWPRLGTVFLPATSAMREITMGHSEYDPAARERRAWNAGRIVGAKRALKPQQVWAIRFWLDHERRPRDRALFDLAIDSKLRGCDVVKPHRAFIEEALAHKPDTTLEALCRRFLAECGAKADTWRARTARLEQARMRREAAGSVRRRTSGYGCCLIGPIVAGVGSMPAIGNPHERTSACCRCALQSGCSGFGQLRPLRAHCRRSPDGRIPPGSSCSFRLEYVGVLPRSIASRDPMLLEGRNGGADEAGGLGCAQIPLRQPCKIGGQR